jgi:hypothetical protein
MGITQGIFAALTADFAPAPQLGTAFAFGMNKLVTGMAMLLASLAAGPLWDIYGSGATFMTGLGITLVAMALTAFLYWFDAFRVRLET